MTALVNCRSSTSYRADDCLEQKHLIISLICALIEMTFVLGFYGSPISHSHFPYILEVNYPGGFTSLGELVAGAIGSLARC
jgi:hypothetical protein